MNRIGCDKDLLADREARVLRQFKRRAHQYCSEIASFTNDVEWLALLRHYGCPTGFLDFTHSFYIAAFFAVEKAIGDAAVWAI